MHIRILYGLFMLVVYTGCWQGAFAQHEPYVVITEITYSGNKVTRQRILMREMPFSVGDTVLLSQLDAQLKQAQSNIMNTHLFNLATVLPVYYDSVHVGIVVDVVEQWYTWPIPIFEIEDTNFNTWLQQTDWYRLNYGMYLERENFRGRREEVVVKFQMGYSEQFALQYKIPFIDKKQHHGLGFTVSYKGNHEITYESENNKRLLYRNTLAYAREELYARIGYQYRKKLYNTHTAQAYFYHTQVDDSTFLLNPEYLPGNALQSKFFVLSYQFKHDKRNFATYAVRGHYFDVELSRYGLSILPDEPDFFVWQLNGKKFFDLGNRCYFSLNAKYRGVSANQVPYYLLKGLGYSSSDLVRAYEYYVIDGTNWFLQRTQFRIGLLENKVLKLKPIPSEKFNTIPVSVYTGLFFDRGYVWDNTMRQNPLANQWLHSVGFSLDFVTFYEMVLRTEYSVNKLGESGIFLHFVAPI